MEAFEISVLITKQCDGIKAEEMGGACSTYGSAMTYVPNISREPLLKDSSWDT
jgi:hypothetical protein